MKNRAIYLSALMALTLVAHADEETPPTNLIDHAKWARETDNTQERIKRLEDFMIDYLPMEEGGTDPNMRGYEDGSHGYAVTGSAWALVRAYVEAGRKDKAMKMLDWLQQYDSKSMLYTVKPKAGPSD